MTITALPTPPSRDDAANFSARADAFLGALPTFATEANATATAVNANAAAAATAAASAVATPATAATSTTAVAVSLGTKTLTVQTGKTYTASMWVAITRTADGSTWMAGPVTSYDTGTGQLIVDVQRVVGSGTYSAWTVQGTAPLISDSTPRNLATGSTIADEDGTPHLIGYRGAPAKAYTVAHTIIPSDAGRTLELGAGSSITLPTDAALGGIDAGDIILFQETAGATRTITPAGGVTLRQCATTNVGQRTLKAYGQAMLRRSTVANTWYCSGDLT